MRPLNDSKYQADAFRQLRKAHQTETEEDYVELISDLIAQKGEARLVDISRCLSVSHATASKLLSRLEKEGLVQSEPYRAVFLTKKGETLARKSKARHEVVLKFLLFLGISEKNAAIDSEGMEHHVSNETLKAFKKFMSSKN